MKNSKGLVTTAVALATVAFTFAVVVPHALADDSQNNAGTVNVSEAQTSEAKTPAVREAQTDLKVVAPAATSSNYSVSGDASTRRSPNAINTYDREAVRNAYLKYFVANDRHVLMSIGADPSKCQPGTVSPEATDMIMKVWNFFRGMDNLDAVSADPASPLARYMQKAALTQAAYNESGMGGGLSHGPASAGYPCADAEANLGSMTANLSQSVGQSPAQQILWWYQDWSGTGESTMTHDGINDELGHRGYLMDPYITESAYGNVDGFSSLAVNTGTNYPDYENARMVSSHVTAPKTMAWPSAGYFPTEMLTSVSRYGADVERWSFRVKDGDMSNVNVTVTGPNGNIRVRVLRPGDDNAPKGISNYGTVLFKMDPKDMVMPKGTNNAVYTVNVTGVRGVDQSNYTYQVKLFNATEVNAKPQVIVNRQPIGYVGELSDPARLTVVGTNVTYQWQYSTDSGKTWQNAPYIRGLSSNVQNTNQLQWNPGVGICHYDDFTYPYTDAACPITKAQAETVRFRVIATNSYGSTTSEALKPIYLGFKNDFPTEVKAGTKLDLTLSFQGNGDWIQPEEAHWQVVDTYQNFGSLDNPVLDTTNLKGKTIIATMRVRTGENCDVTYMTIRSHKIYIR